MAWRLTLTLLTDAAMDAAVLAVTQRALDRLCLGRLLRGMAVLMLCSSICLLGGVPGWLGQLLACPLAAYALLGGGWRLVAEGAACIYAAYAALAGFVLASGWRACIVAPSVLLLSMLLRRRSHPLCRWNVEICIEKNGVRACIPALIDTGNRLRDRLCGMPVLIAEEESLRQISASLHPSELHRLSYGVLGSGGSLHCFSPDGVWLAAGGGWRRAPQCRVALFPGSIPGAIRALAPPEFARCAALRRRHPIDAGAKVPGSVRRFIAWRFQA